MSKSAAACLRGRGIVVELGELTRRALLTPREGAVAALQLATDPALAGVTGRHYVLGSALFGR